MLQQLSATVTIQVPDNKVIVDKAYLEGLKADSIQGKTWNLETFRKQCCCGKSVDWVRLYILTKFRDEIEVKDSQGWAIIGQGKGHKTIIFADKACKWHF